MRAVINKFIYHLHNLTAAVIPCSMLASYAALRIYDFAPKIRGNLIVSDNSPNKTQGNTAVRISVKSLRKNPDCSLNKLSRLTLMISI